MQKALHSKEIQERLLSAGMEPAASRPEDMPAFMSREQKRYEAVIKAANIRLEE
jgi:tripartite-type tricarboxylate transporter receptor subunit TctC